MKEPEAVVEVVGVKPQAVPAEEWRPPTTAQRAVGQIQVPIAAAVVRVPAVMSTAVIEQSLTGRSRMSPVDTKATAAEEAVAAVVRR